MSAFVCHNIILGGVNSMDAEIPENESVMISSSLNQKIIDIIMYVAFNIRSNIDE